MEMSDIREINLVMNKETQKHKGFAFIELIDPKFAVSLLELDGIATLLGSCLNIRPAHEKSIKLQGNQDNYRSFGTQDYSSLAIQVDKRHKKLVSEQIARNEKARIEYLKKKEEKEKVEKEFVEAGGKLLGGLGHGYANGKAKLHSGYSNFEM